MSDGDTETGGADAGRDPAIEDPHAGAGRKSAAEDFDSLWPAAAAAADDDLALPDEEQLWPGEAKRRSVESKTTLTDADLADLGRPTAEPRSPVPVARQPRVLHPVPGASGIARLLRTAAARGASTLYVTSNAQPAMRIDGEIHIFETEETLGAGVVESLLLGAMPQATHAALRSGNRSEWISDVPDVGRVLCVSFHDHRGASGIFRLTAENAVSADELGLSPEVQALGLEPDGLVLVTGPRSSGKRSVISALVDLINRERHDYVITLEGEIHVVHALRGSVVSQREVRGESEDLLATVRTALRDDPDVLVIEELQTDAIIRLALKAAGSGHLVIGGLLAHTATDAVDRLLNEYPAEHRQHARVMLAENLRGVVAQVPLRKTDGGRLMAREVLLNTPAVARLIVEGKTSELPMAIETGQKIGMVSLNNTLVGLVQSGAVDVREAYRRAGDRPGFLASLKRQGIDTAALDPLT